MGIADYRVQIADYCRDIETYLCRKNDGHLIRVVGPSFDLGALEFERLAAVPADQMMVVRLGGASSIDRLAVRRA